MELEEYGLIFNLEQDHWWYKGLRNLVFSTLNLIFNHKEIIQILDAGCGTGLFLKFLSAYGNVVGIDISQEAIKYCKIRGLNRILKASIMQIPFQNESFDLVISNDVLYHRLVTDDRIAIQEIYRVLRKNGFFLLNLPAYNFIWRRHDARIHTGNRYTKNEVYSRLLDTKFKILKISYHNAFLLLPVLFLKLMHKKNNPGLNSDLKTTSKMINSLLYSLLKIENRVMKNINIPFGTSIFCIAQK